MTFFVDISKMSLTSRIENQEANSSAYRSGGKCMWIAIIFVVVVVVAVVVVVVVVTDCFYLC